MHGLRHSCCAILFQQGYDLAQVQAWLGHSDIAVAANI
ncbi:MAG: tyrosine-type recombinase/integrase [Lachnospiraceae bacterium]|nr:tyrosine-type recombinase/integrase [Lachnospiraceae bacterium]